MTVKGVVQLGGGVVFLLVVGNQFPYLMHRATGFAPILSAALICIGILVALLPTGCFRRMDRLLMDTPGKLFYGLIMLLAMVFCSLMAHLVFENSPRLTDAISYIWQARVFASGAMTQPLPEVPEAFQLNFILGDTQDLPHNVSMYPPGWPGLLSLGVAVGLGWLVNPLLSALLCGASALLAHELAGKRAARITALLALGSPLLLKLGGTYLAHTMPTLGLCLAAWCTLRLVRRGNWFYGAGGGGGMILALTSRPVDAVLVGLLIALYPLSQIRDLRRFRAGIPWAIGVALTGVVIVAGWQQITLGDWSQSGHKLGLGRDGHFGYGNYRSDSAPFVFDHATAVIQSRARMQAWNEQLLGWPVIGSLILVLPFLRRRASWLHVWLLLPTAVLALLFHFFWYYEHFFEARYLFSAIPFAWVLAGLVLADLKGNWARIGIGLAAAGFLFHIAVGMPHLLSRFTPVYGVHLSGLDELEEHYDLHNALVFFYSPIIGWDPVKKTKFRIHDRAAWWHGIPTDYHCAAFLRNNLARDGDIVYAINLADSYAENPDHIATYGPSKAPFIGLGLNLQLARQYKGRAIYVLKYHRDRSTFDLTSCKLRPDGTNFEDFKIIGSEIPAGRE